MSRPRTVYGVVCVVLALVTVLVYLPVRHYGFVSLDDPGYVSENPTVQAGLTWTGVQWAFTTMAAANWHPLTWLSLMLDCQLFGVNGGWSHLVNVFFHAANAVLLFVLLMRLTGASWPSACIAALFAWHPLRVESVAWVSERKDVLSAFFGLLTLLAYARYAQRRSRVESPASGATTSAPGAEPIQPSIHLAVDTRRSTLAYLLALLFFALGLMAKPMLVTLPFVFLLLDYWPLQRVPQYELRWSHWRRLIGEKWPFFALAAASCVVTFVAQQHGKAVAPLEGYPLPARLANTAVAYVKYLGKSVYPVDLTVLYPLPREIAWGQTAGALVMLAVISGLVWRARMSRPYLLTGWLWYLGMLVPVIGIVQVGSQAMADRYTYLPQIGVLIGVVFGLGELVKKLRVPAVAVASVAGMVLAGCLWLTARQLRYWRDGIVLMEHALALTKDNFVAQNNLAITLGKAGDVEGDIEHLREALRIAPHNVITRYNLGNALARAHHLPEAIEQYREALRFDPDDVMAHYNLGNALGLTGRLPEAIQQYQEALRLKPDFAFAHNNLGHALFRTGHPQEAIQQYQEALRLKPDDAEAHFNLGNALLQTGHLQEAIQHFEEALRLKPDYAGAHCSFGNALLETGNFQKASEQFRATLRLKPDFAPAHNGLGHVLEQTGHIREAIGQYRLALQDNPDQIEALNNLAWLLATGPEARLRNGAEAVRLAEHACAVTHDQMVICIGTLAAAYAEAGRFEDATNTAEKAIGLATTRGATNLLQKNRQLLDLYRAGRPYHQTPKSK